MDLHLTFFQDYKAGLAITEVELTAANIRDVDRRSFEINTPFKNFWYVHMCLSLCPVYLAYVSMYTHAV